MGQESTFQPDYSPPSSSCSSHTSHFVSERAKFLYTLGPLHLLSLLPGFSSFSSSYGQLFRCHLLRAERS